MKITITKDFPYQFLFALCVGVTYINIYELTFAVWLLAIVLTIKNKYSFTLLRYILPHFFILVIAFFSFFFYDNTIYDAIRDVTYLTKPIIGFIVGYQLCNSYNCKPYHTIIYTGFSIALIHFGILGYNVVVHRITQMHELRHLAGYFSDFEVYSLILVQFHKQLNINLTQKRFWLLLLIIGISSFLYLSRTNFIQYGVLFFAMKGYLNFNKRAVKVILISVFVSSIGYAFIYNTNPQRNGKGIEALLYKIKNAPIEPFKTKINKDDYEDFNDNYRSYENIIAVRQVSIEGISGILIGKGLGSSIDIGRKMLTNDGTFVRLEPILHNGYMTVFLKSGLVGVFFMIYFLYHLFKQNKSNLESIKRLNLLLIGTALFLIISNWVLLGLFLKLDNKSILIGFLLCFKELTLKQHQLEYTKES
jgi:hypothetical protein